MKMFQVKLSLLLVMFWVGIGAAQKDTIAIIDAGSSGSRLWIYTVDKTNAETKSLFSYKVEPGLSYFAEKNDSAGLVSKIDTLLRKAGANINKGTQFLILATAGMRMVNEDKAKTVYRQITNWTKEKSYNLINAKTISGQYEGFYAWIATGIKNGHLGISGGKLTYHGEPFGIVELGGASMQQAFPLNSKESNSISRFGTANIYSKSYLGWGIDQVDLSKQQIASKNEKYRSGEPYLRDEKIVWYQLGGGFIKDSLSYQKKYKSWLLKNKSNLKLIPPPKPSDWTEGAAIDVIINEEKPEKFDYNSPN